MSAVLKTSLTAARENFVLLAATVVSANIVPSELRRHIDGLKALEVTQDFFGDFAQAASIILEARIMELEQRYKVLRAEWQEHLDALIDACKIDPKEMNPSHGPEILARLSALEEGQRDGYKEEALGDLMEEAVRVTDEGVRNHKRALADISLMVVDPDSVPQEIDVSVEALEFALTHSKKIPLTLNTFFGDEAKLAEAQRRFPLWIERQEKLLAKRRAEEEKRLVAAVEVGIEARDEMEHRNRVNDAGLTAEQRGARQARMHDAVQPMYDLIRRVTEIAQLNEVDHTGVIDGDGLLEVAQRAEAVVARIEGRVN